MFYVRTAFANIRRYRYKSLLNIFICIVAVLFLNLYTGSLQKSKEQLESLPKKIPVEATITNLQGGRASGIFIKEAYYEEVMKAKEVADPRFTISVLGVRDTEEWAVQAANTWKAISGISQEMLDMKEGDVDTFFASNARECLVSNRLMEQHGLTAGQEITLDLQYYELVDHQEIYAQPLETVTYKIAGTIKEEEGQAAEGAVLPDVIVPIETIRESYHNQDVKFFVDSGVFYVKNPLRLNDFKKEMEEVGFMEVISQADPALEGHALVVRDETFIRTSGSMGEGYRVMRNFLPVICIVLASAGFITSYLLTNGRRQEYATMRSMGVSRRACMFIYLLEHGAAEILGGMTGTALAAWIVKVDISWLVIDFGGFLICFLAGTFTAIMMLGKVSVMEVLAKAD